MSTIQIQTKNMQALDSMTRFHRETFTLYLDSKVLEPCLEMAQS